MENFRIFKELYKNFLTDQKKRFITYGILSFVCVFLECFGLSAILPALQFILNPEKLYAVLPPWLADIPQTRIIAGLVGICTVSIVLRSLLSIAGNNLIFKITTTSAVHITEKLVQLERNTAYKFFLKCKQSELQTIHDKCLDTRYSYHLYHANVFFLNGALCFAIGCMVLFFIPVATLFFILSAIVIFFITEKLQTNREIPVGLYERKEQLFNTSTASQKEASCLFSEIPPQNTLLAAFAKWKQSDDYFENKGTSKTFFIELLGLICISITVLLLHLFYPFSVLMKQITFLVVCIVRILPYFNRFYMARQQIDACKSSVVYLNDFYRQLLEHQLPPYDGERVSFNHRLRLEKVCFSYDTETKKEVLHDVCLTVNEGDFVGLTGKSGAGKTTLVDMILGLLPPTKGTYSVDGNIITTHNQLAPFFGYVSQNPCIITGTVAENVIFGREPNAEQVERVLKMAQLDEFQPDMYLAENGKNISGGQKQRIAIARALYGNPKLLILDEATASLDALTEEKISNVIASLKGKCTVIAIAHRLGTLKQCNRLVYMKEGRIAAEGTFNGLYQANEEFKELVDALERQSHLVHGDEAVAATAAV
jgi:ABC-type multidrug transport system fused ATPase/permease subunit